VWGFIEGASRKTHAKYNRHVSEMAAVFAFKPHWPKLIKLPNVVFLREAEQLLQGWFGEPVGGRRDPTPDPRRSLLLNGTNPEGLSWSSTAGSLSPKPPEPAGPKGLPNMQAALFVLGASPLVAKMERARWWCTRPPEPHSANNKARPYFASSGAISTITTVTSWHRGHSKVRRSRLVSSGSIKTSHIGVSHELHHRWFCIRSRGRAS